MARCPHCRQTYKPERMGQKCCKVIDCIIKAGQSRKAKEAEKQAKAERAAFKVRKEAAKQSKTLQAEAQAAINAYRRYQDIASGHGCIDCGQPFEPQKPGGSVDAGHYLSRGSHPHLAFVEMNINAQKKNCNRPGGTTAAAHRLGMIARYGLAAVEALEADTTPRRYRADDYRAIRDTYRAKLKELKHEQLI